LTNGPGAMIGYRVHPSNKSEEPPWKTKIL
jgi:hypothetical protein